MENRFGNDGIARMAMGNGAAVPTDLAILDGLTAGVACIDATGRVVYANRQWCAWLGAPALSWFDWPWEPPFSDTAFVSTLMHQALSMGRVVFDARLHAAQAPLQLQCTLSCLGGEAPVFLLLANDLTTLHEQLQHAQQQQRQLSSLIDAIPAAVACKGVDGRYQQCNAAFERLVARPQAAIIGKTSDELGIEDGLADDGDRDALVLQTGRPVVYEEAWSLGAGEHQTRLETTKTAIRDGEGRVTGVLRLSRDLSDPGAERSEMERLAYFDTTTGLPNRSTLLDRLKWAVEDSRQRGSFCALLFIDLDHFKNLNDSQGHRHGDQLLAEVGKRLMTCVRSGDMVARFGGDEFVILVEHLGHERQEAMAHVRSVVDHLILRLRQPFDLFGHWYYTTPSVGVTVFGDDEVPEVEELLKRVDMAMYEAKSAGRNTQCFFDPQMQTVVNARASMEADLRQALLHGELCVHYQPVTDQQGALLGAEALVRWMHPVQGMVGPTDFIELAEQTGLIVELGRFVMRTACEQLARWARVPATAALTMSVNVSPRQFRHPKFVDEVLALIDSTRVDPRRLKLELTENLLLGDLAETVQRMGELKARGVGFALDDFGIGYSSLRYLKALPLDQLKVDRSFVNDVPTDPNGAAIVRAILTLAQSLNMEALAEGVESAAQVEFLTSHGCTRFQGFHFGRPMPIEDFERSTLFQATAAAVH
ncbi:MAG: putative bifunctional diguanylate cyclase/phosphodiesterase [Comamonas sp.]